MRMKQHLSIAVDAQPLPGQLWAEQKERAMSAAESFLRAETEDVLVTEWRLAPGAGTGQHRHNLDLSWCR
jgi:quercetin dioxygenase-like cupin family protein